MKTTVRKHDRTKPSGTVKEVPVREHERELPEPAHPAPLERRSCKDAVSKEQAQELADELELELADVLKALRKPGATPETLRQEIKDIDTRLEKLSGPRRAMTKAEKVEAAALVADLNRQARGKP